MGRRDSPRASHNETRLLLPSATGPRVALSRWRCAFAGTLVIITTATLLLYVQPVMWNQRQLMPPVSAGSRQNIAVIRGGGETNPNATPKIIEVDVMAAAQFVVSTAPPLGNEGGEGGMNEGGMNSGMLPGNGLPGNEGNEGGMNSGMLSSVISRTKTIYERLESHSQRRNSSSSNTVRRPIPARPDMFTTFKVPSPPAFTVSEGSGYGTFATPSSTAIIASSSIAVHWTVVTPNSAANTAPSRAAEEDLPPHRTPALVTPKAPCPVLKPPRLTVNGGGRLGNKLCQYFTLWAEHRTNFTDTSVWISSKMAAEFSRQFAGRRSISHLPAHCKPAKLKAVTMDAIGRGLEEGSDVCIAGGVCDVAGFARYRDELLAQFPWRQDLAAVAEARLAAAARRHACGGVSNCTFIGVHMRRTDYSKWIQWRMNGSSVGTEYFQCALSLCRRRYPGAVFIVASDDVKWARANILGGDVTLAAELVPPGALASRAAALDMATLSMCNHTIVSYGTFGLMAAFMAGGDIVAPTGYSPSEHFVTDAAIRAGLPVTLLHYRTCQEVPLDKRTPFLGLPLQILCDMI